MFIKRCTRNKNGKQHAYWELVESCRTAREPRHRTVAYLGELSPSQKHGWARLAGHLDGKAASKTQQQLLLFETPDNGGDCEPSTSPSTVSRSGPNRSVESPVPDHP